MKSHESENKPIYIEEHTEAIKSDFQENITDTDRNHFTKRYAPVARQDQAAKLRMIRLRKKIGLIDEDGEKKELEQTQKDFDDKFKDLEHIHKQEESNLRSVEQISKKEKVIFVHSVPLDIDERWGTQDNNTMIQTEQMNILERVGMIVHEDISISCSTVSTDTEKEYGKKTPKTMYPFGVVIDSGTILSAHRYDGGISTNHKIAKHRKYDRGDQSVGFQQHIEGQIEYALHGPFSHQYEKDFQKKHGHINKGSNLFGSYNELIVEKPKVSGFFIDADKTHELEYVRKKQMSYSDTSVYDPMDHSAYTFEGFRWKEMKKVLAQFPDVPVYIKEHGQMKEYVCRDGDLRAVQEDGKVEKTEATHRVDEYELPHATKHFHTRDTESEIRKAKENGSYSFTAKELGVIIDQKLYDGVSNTEGNTPYSKFLAQKFMLAFVDSESVPFDDVVKAVSADYKENM